MSSSENTAQKATCRICHSSITNMGKGWYHGPERSIRVQPYHFAEPMAAAR